MGVLYPLPNMIHCDASYRSEEEATAAFTYREQGTLRGVYVERLYPRYTWGAKSHYCEVLAIVRALEWCCALSLTEVEVYSDCKFAVDLVTASNSPQVELYQRLQVRANTLYVRSRCTLQHVTEKHPHQQVADFAATLAYEWERGFYASPSKLKVLEP